MKIHFSWTHERAQLIGRTCNLKSKKRHLQREMDSSTCLPEAKTYYELARENRNPGGHRYHGNLHPLIDFSAIASLHTHKND